MVLTSHEAINWLLLAAPQQKVNKLINYLSVGRKLHEQPREPFPYLGKGPG